MLICRYINESVEGMVSGHTGDTGSSGDTGSTGDTGSSGDTGSTWDIDNLDDNNIISLSENSHQYSGINYFK